MWRLSFLTTEQPPATVARCGSSEVTATVSLFNAVAANNYSENANLLARFAGRRLRAPITVTEIA